MSAARAVDAAGPAFHRVRLARPDDAAGWREAARACLAAAIPPEAIVWEAGEPTADLFGEEIGESASLFPQAASADHARVARVPPAFLELAERVACHRDPDRFALLYRVLWRRAHGEPDLLERASDPDVHRLQSLGKRVARERHKMHAFVRFRRTPGVEPEHYGAWFEPEHRTLRLASAFFVRRFANMRWSIVTPEESAHWDGERLSFGPGGTRGARPEPEAMEALWHTYFASIFNPARLKLDAMRAEMPVKYWKNLPETRVIGDLVREAHARMTAMVDARPATPPRFAARAAAAVAPSTEPPLDPCRDVLPRDCADLEELRARVDGCARCEHACYATRAVHGVGAVGAPLMIVGEQPGDREDLRGRPFVGPAGALLHATLAELGAPPESLYLTNAVRHFRFEVRGKRRLHRRPDAAHVESCRAWLFEEIRLVAPRAVLALGATAGRALLGRAVSVGRERGRVYAFGDDRTLVVGLHPAAVLRERDEARRAALEAALGEDVARAMRAAGIASGDG